MVTWGDTTEDSLLLLVLHSLVWCIWALKVSSCEIDQGASRLWLITAFFRGAVLSEETYHWHTIIMEMIPFWYHFDTIDHSLLLHRLEHVIGIKGTAIDWFKSYLSDRFQFVHVHGVSSAQMRVCYGVPQGSVLGPILFTSNILYLGKIIQSHGINFHCYTDDTQLYLSMKPEELEPLAKLQGCLKNIKTWMSSAFWFKIRIKQRLLSLVPNLRNGLADFTLASSTTVRNLGVIFWSGCHLNSILIKFDSLFSPP